MEWLKNLLRRLGIIRPKERVSRRSPRFDLPCDWCKQVAYTTEEEVWCNADPTGHIKRLCVSYREGTAAR